MHWAPSLWCTRQPNKAHMTENLVLLLIYLWSKNVIKYGQLQILKCSVLSAGNDLNSVNSAFVINPALR